MKEFASLIRSGFSASAVLAGILFAGVMLQALHSGAQVTTNITSSGLGTALNGSTVVPCAGGTCDITGGTRRGANLFHSFGSFDVATGDIANFLNDSGLATSNVLGRVNGGQTSSIFGTIQTTDFGSANLYLTNPAGWIFGPTASLNVGGSFHVSTADYIRLDDGVRFSVDGLNDALLTSAPPAAFGFLGVNQPASISVNGSSLQVPEGQTLSLVGGDVQITADADTGFPSFLSAPSGRVQIGSFASEGEATINGLNGSFVGLGRVEISGGSSVDGAGAVSVDADGNPLASNGGTVLIRGAQVDISGASLNASGAQVFDSDFNPVGGSAGGTVIIRGGRLFVDSSSMVADTFGDVNGAPGGIDIQMTDSIEVTNGTSIATATSGAGRGGDVELTASQVMLDGSLVSTFTFGDGRAGDISVDNVGQLSLTAFSEINSLNLSFGAGSAGNVTVTASELIDISGGSKLSNTTFFNGNGGELTISAPSFRVSGEGSGIITSTTDIVGGGSPGNVAIDVGELRITDGAQLGSFASTLDGGRGGNLTVHAGSALISGTDAGGFASGIYSSNSVGAAGDIFVNAARLTLTGGAVIESGNVTDPRGGNVTISANESIVISEGSGVTLRAFSEDVGQLTITAPTGSLSIDNGFVSTSTTEAGRAGDIAVNVRTLALTEGGQITSSSEAFASGAGGNVTITADSVSISGSSPSGVPSSPFSTDPRSGVFTTTAGTGPGGTINIQAAQLRITDGAVVSANSTGTASATAGNINVVVSDTLRMEDGSITTEALVADGGNISITSTGSLLHLTNSQITTSVQSGSGGGGNITIGSNLHPFDFIVLNNSGIHANAFGGPGGNINIFADTFLSSLPIATAVTASSALSTPGIIDIQATIVDVSGDVSQLPEAPLQATELLRASCAARIAGGKTSSLVLAGRGGLPLEPGGLLPSPIYNSPGANAAASDQGASRLSILGQNERLPLARVAKQHGLPSANLRCSS